MFFLILFIAEMFINIKTEDVLSDEGLVSWEGVR